MATDALQGLERQSPAEIQSTISQVKTMLKIGAVFAAVGYLLIGMALTFELTQFHPAIDQYVSTYTNHSLAGGGPDRAGVSGLNGDLASLHHWPSFLLWLKLGGVGHILVGIFIALAAIVRVLSLVPHRLSYEMERTQGAAAQAAQGDHSDSGDAGGATPADD